MNARDQSAVAFAPAKDAVERIDGIDWAQVSIDLDAQGSAMIEGLLSRAECDALAALYSVGGSLPQPRGDGAARFRTRRVQVLRLSLAQAHCRPAHGALPAPGADRQSLEQRRWVSTCSSRTKHADFIERCHAAGQLRPTPLLLQYGVDDYNCLHQDLYGAQVFPLQVAILLSEPGRDFTGGEFVIAEQRPRMQSRPEVVPLCQGDAAVFAVHHRPVQGARGVYRVNLRHGVSRVRSGHRHTVGVIFHDAT